MDFDILRLLRAISKDRKETAAVIIAGLALFAFITGFFGQFIIFMLIIAELVLAFFMGEFEIRQIGMELVTLITVLSGVLYGPIAGLVMGAVLVTLRFILTRMLGPYVLYSIPAMGIVGILAGYSMQWFGSITTAGIVLSVAYNIITASMGSLVMHDFFQELLWSGSNIVVNIALFSYVAPIILAVA
jgi:hypothetical protein